MLKEELLKLLEEDKEFRFTVAGFLGYRNVLERLEEHDKKFNEILSEIQKLREDFNKLSEDFNKLSKELAGLREEFRSLSMRVEVTIGSMGRRWGTDLERTVLELFKEVLVKRRIEPGKVEKFRVRDEDGSLTGVRGRIVDVDALIENEKVYVIEVKSRAELEHIEALPSKANVVSKVLKKPIAEMLVVAINVDKEAYERAKELGIEVICGHVLE